MDTLIALTNFLTLLLRKGAVVRVAYVTALMTWGLCPRAFAQGAFGQGAYIKELLTGGLCAGSFALGSFGVRGLLSAVHRDSYCIG